MTQKFYKRGIREFYAVSDKRVIRIVNKEVANYITVAIPNHFIGHDALEGKEITRDEFKKQFEEASRLIVLEE